MAARDKTCPQCGDALAALAWGTGWVWRCDHHGVKEWWFERDESALADAVRAEAVARRPRAAALDAARPARSDLGRP